MNADVTPDALVTDVVTAHPATIAVFQRRQVNFCCGGNVSIADACRQHGLDSADLLAELAAAMSTRPDADDWRAANLTDLTRHIQLRYHEPLRAELPRLEDLLTRVLRRHGETYPAMLLPLRDHFNRMAGEMLHHMQKEDVVLFPAFVALEKAATASDGRDYGRWDWIEQPMHLMEAEHASTNAKLKAMREATGDYTLPDGACPTFRGLFHGLVELERDLRAHVHLENDILFPRAARLAQELER